MEALRTTDEKIEYLREEVKKLSSSVKNVHEEYNKITQFEKELHKLRQMEELRDTFNHSADILFEFIATLRHIGPSLFRNGLVYSRDCFIVLMLVAMVKYGGKEDKAVKQDLKPEEHSSTNLTPNIGPKVRTLADSFGEAILKYLG